ncbi:MAG: TolC family protein [Bacteroidota bacterium]
MKINQIIANLLLITSLNAFTQERLAQSLTLEDCIAIALENNLDLRSANLGFDRAEVNFKQSKGDFLPSINGNFNIGVNNGRSIDPFTNDFINQRLEFSSANFNLNMTVFNGFRLINQLKRDKLNKLAAEMEIEEAKQDLTLRVTLAYLQVLNSRDLLTLAKNRFETTTQQLEIQKEFYDNESGNPADYADILGQITLDETSILSSESSLNNAKLALLQLLNLTESNASLNAQTLILDFEEYPLSAEEVYQDAVENLATFKARELRVDASKKGVSAAKAQFVPEISFFAGLNTNYSSAAQLFTESGSALIETGDFVTVNGENLPVQSEITSFDSADINFFDQFDNNLNTNIGLSLRIPIMNGFQAKNSVALEKIRVEESLVALEQTQIEIKNAISQVHFDMETVYARYQSLEKQVAAFEESYRINEIRFNNGISNFLNYVTSKNNLDNAKINLTNAKYEYLLRTKVLEYYRGNVF